MQILHMVRGLSKKHYKHLQKKAWHYYGQRGKQMLKVATPPNRMTPHIGALQLGLVAILCSRHFCYDPKA